MKYILRVVLCTGAIFMTAALAQTVDPQNVLIRNVHLLDGGEGTKGVLVNILIKDNKLEIITKDVVTVDDSILAVDARAGYLLGQLKIGETPSSSSSIRIREKTSRFSSIPVSLRSSLCITAGFSKTTCLKSKKKRKSRDGLDGQPMHLRRWHCQRPI